MRVEDLRGAPEVHGGDLVDARNGAIGSAGFFGEKFAAAVLGGVVGERNAGVAALLGAIMNEAVLADVEIAGTGAAAPVVLASGGDVVLEPVDAGEGALAEAHDLFKDLLLAGTERLNLAVAVVDETDGGSEAESEGTMGNLESVFRIPNAAAEDGVDIDVKFGVVGEELELLVEDFEALFGDVVGDGVINADLEVLEASAIEAFDAVGDEEVSVGDEAGDDAVFADAGDDGVEIGVEERFAAADSDDGSAHRAKSVNAAEHFIGGHRL